MGTNVSGEIAALIFRNPNMILEVCGCWPYGGTSQCKCSLPNISYNIATFGEFWKLKLCYVYSREATVFFIVPFFPPLRSNDSNTEQVKEYLYVIKQHCWSRITSIVLQCVDCRRSWKPNSARKVEYEFGQMLFLSARAGALYGRRKRPRNTN
jgi:hypothetical protein